MSFGWTGHFRQGAWRDFRYFILNQRRDVIRRITTINAELARIGNIRIAYARSDPNNPNSPMTESRVGIDVTPGTSLHHLLQAYIANGGNPFDISMFLARDQFEAIPESVDIPTTADGADDQPSVRENQPYGGTASAETTDPITGGVFTGGWLPLWRYPPRRFGTSQSYADHAAEMTRTIHAARHWVKQEIKYLRNDLEARIIKLCDLREQLIVEMNEIVPQAIGGSVPGLPYNLDTFATTHNVATIVDGIDAVYYPQLQDGSYDLTDPTVSYPNPVLPVLLDDAPNGEEDWTAIG